MINATPLASGRTHEALPKCASPLDTRLGRIHIRRPRFTALISLLTTKISVKSTSSGGLRKSFHMAFLRSSRRLHTSLYSASKRAMRSLVVRTRCCGTRDLNAEKINLLLFRFIIPTRICKQLRS